jgi:hypothetical protein
MVYQRRAGDMGEAQFISTMAERRMKTVLDGQAKILICDRFV